MDPLVAGAEINELPTYADDDDFAATSVSFDFTQPPIVAEPEGILVEGASTDGAIAGTDPKPINGGVILAGTSPNGEGGDAKISAALAEPGPIEPAGMRTLGPFDCKALSGFACCLLIKNAVRDRDVHDRAIQCMLDYEETTCKKKWWIEGEHTKKVLIHANDNRKVTQTPMVTGSWAACSGKWGDVKRNWNKKWINYRCGAKFNNQPCEEGYCCSAFGYCGKSKPWCDTNCQSQCWASSLTSGFAYEPRCGAAREGLGCHGTHCCSKDNFCGPSANHCDRSKGCQFDIGTCWA